MDGTPEGSLWIDPNFELHREPIEAGFWGVQVWLAVARAAARLRNFDGFVLDDFLEPKVVARLLGIEEEGPMCGSGCPTDFESIAHGIARAVESKLLIPGKGEKEGLVEIGYWDTWIGIHRL